MQSRILLFSVVALLALVSVRADGEADVDEKDVVVLTSDNFEKERDSHDFMLIEFYAPWCGHCKKLKPEYAKAATSLVADGVEKSTAVLAKIDCTAHKDVCDKYEVRGYPTLKWFKKGSEKTEDFEGARNAAGIAEFVRRFSGPVLSDLANKEAIDALTKTSKVVVVAFQDAGDSTKEHIAAAAEELRAEASFGIAPASVSSEYGHDGSSSVFIFVSFEDKPIRLEATVTAPKDIIDFVRRESFPAVQEISPENYKSYVDRAIPLVWTFLEKDGRDKNIEIIRVAAASSKGRLSWVWLDATDYGRHAENMGLSDKYPGIVIDDQGQKKKFLYPEDGQYESDALSTWAGQVLSGDIAPFVKSEPIPEDNSQPLTKVVGKNYEDVVLDKSKDVLLEFYAPWCGHCKQLAPKYEALAQFFKDEPSIVVSQVDGTANDVPLDVQGFPTIFFFPSGDKENPLTYGGERTASAMAEFIIKHSTTLSEDSKKKLNEANVPEEEEEEDEFEEDEDDDSVEKDEL